MDETSIINKILHLSVPNNQDLNQEILREADISCYTIHPGYTKMYKDSK